MSPMTDISPFRQSPNVLASHYEDASVGLKLLLTGHVQQALPDIARDAYSEHWQYVSKYGHECFDLQFDQSLRIRDAFAHLIHSKSHQIALASSIHELFIRFLSCLDITRRRRIITTSDEHPSILRQLVALKKQGVELVVLDSQPAATVTERLADALTDDTAAVCVSTVNHVTGQRIDDLDVLIERCHQREIELFVDAYLSVNVLDFNIQDNGLKQAFVAGGGAKYCQMGDGVCFMHVPPHRNLSPTVTGWYGVFDLALDSPAKEPLIYADIVASRFDGSTKDTLPHFRAEKVFEFFKSQGLNQALLQAINQHQISVLLKTFHDQDFDPDMISTFTEENNVGSFVAFRTSHSQRLQAQLRDIGVICDNRGDFIRFGPAPYLSDEQLTDAIIALKETVSMIKK